MRSRSSTTRWNLFFHYVSFGFIIISGVILVPLYLAHVPVALYGAWLASGNILAWLSMADPGVSTVLMQRIALSHGARDRIAVHEFVSSGVLVSVLVSCAVISVGVVAAPYLGQLLHIDAQSAAELNKAFVLAVFGTGFIVLSYTFFGANMGLQSSVGVGLILVGATCLSISTAVYILLNGGGLIALGAAILVRGAAMLLGSAGYLIYRLRRDLPGFVFSLRRFREIANLLQFQILGQIGNTLINQLDAFLVARLIGAESVPLLLLTRRGPETFRMLAERPAVAFMPALAHTAGAGHIESAKPSLIRLLSMILWLLGLLVGGFLLFNRSFVSLWVGPQFYAGHPTNILICAGMLVAVATRTFGSITSALGNLKKNNLAVMAESFIFVFSAIIGALALGILGVALAPIVALGLTTAWYYPSVFWRLVKLDREELRAIAGELIRVLILLAGLCWAFAYWGVDAATWRAFATKVTTFGASYGIGLYVISKKARTEIAKLIALTRARAGV
jgi:O-antigen/teichoic acid export membrane protein